jgi:hypothetical protein
MNTTPGMRAGLKSVLRHLIGACAAGSTSGAQRVGLITGAAPGTISRWQGDGYPDLMPLDVALLLTQETGSTVVAAAFADACGHRLVPIGDDEAQAGRPAMIDDLVGFHAGAGSFSARLAEGLADGSLSPREAKDALAALHSHQDRNAETARRLTVIAEGGGHD